ncbi:hypothetical protein MXC99_01930 [Thauera aromatica]|uniref:hypothetical protein n=1 Tax=Thauera aromatica TaxID=59405 RepID=UPI001FFC6214|nr:hypothetical protein [Thauera aromatica]MCK2086948.1 hypothetical protein [Thauera aromatica]
MQTSAPTPISRIPGRPTIVLLAPQGTGKTLFSAALTTRLNCTHCLDDRALNGAPTIEGADIPHDGALVLGIEGGGGDLTITVHTQAGFDALLTALRIPLEHRPPYAKQAERGPGPDFGWGTSPAGEERRWPPRAAVFIGTTNEPLQPPRD